MGAGRTIVIAGAGIGGLTASLALAARGYRIIVLEKAERLEEAGAGLQLSPNAGRVLCTLGLKSAIAARATSFDAISLMSVLAGGEIARIPLVNVDGFRSDVPYWVMHRADLQAVLLAAVRDHPEIELRLGCAFEDAASHADRVIVAMRRGPSRDHEVALALIGADGVWSAVRDRLFPRVKPQFAGLIAWRGTFDAGRVPPGWAANEVQLWMGPDAHLVSYPISGGRQINVVAIVRGERREAGWSDSGDAGEIRARLGSAWPAAARMQLDRIAEFKRHALFTMPDGGVWHSGAIALLGDASHAMLPFAAQGAGMAIEDAAVLAKCLGPFGKATSPPAVAAALAAFAGQRRGRIARVQRAAKQSGQIYHLRGPMAAARDLAMRALGGKRLLARQSWIYDWKG